MKSSQHSPTMRDNKYFNLQQLMIVNNLCEKMRYKIEKTENNDQMHQKRVFLIMGTTTSGKTVVQYYLCQDPLVYGIDQSKQLPYIIPSKIYNNSIVQKTPSTITTRIPNIRQISNQQVLLIEIPDIKQLKHQEQSIEYLFLRKIFKEMNKLHIIVVIQEPSLSDLGEIMENLQCITELFDIKDENVRELISQNMSIVVNKVNEDSDDSDVKSSLQQVNDDAIAQESQQLSQIITNILKQDRIYLIKNTQPEEKEQKELLKYLLQYSKFMSFSQQKLLGNYLNQIGIESQQVVETMISKLRVKELWENEVKALETLLRFLTDSKILTQENTENKQLIQEVRRMVQKDWQQLQQQYSTKHGNNEQELKKFTGKRPNNIILPLLVQLIKAITSSQAQQQDESILYEHTIELIELLKELRETIRKELIIAQTKDILNANKIEDYFNYTLSLRYLLKCIHHLQLLLDYITQILNYTSDSSQQKSSQQQKQLFHKQCLINLIKQLFQKSKQAFINFDITLLKTKSKSKSIKKVKTITVKKPNPTIEQLKRQFENQIKQKENTTMLNQIMNLPHSHFKLYLLIQQFKQLIKETNTIKFMEFTIVIKQIASLLHTYQFYIEEVKFLIMIPDWNRIAIAIDAIERLRKLKGGNNILNVKEVEFLNKVKIYARQSNMKKVADKIFSIVDSLQISKQNANDSNDDQSHINERQVQNSYDNWLKIYINYLSQEYNQQPNSKSPFWKIIDKAKRYEQLNSERINKFNQQMLLMKQHFQ